MHWFVTEKRSFYASQLGWNGGVAIKLFVV